MVINGIKLFPRQQEIITDILSSKKRFIAIVASRQFSKSTILENLMMYRALNNFNIKLLLLIIRYYHTSPKNAESQDVNGKKKIGKNLSTS